MGPSTPTVKRRIRNLDPQPPRSPGTGAGQAPSIGSSAMIRPMNPELEALLSTLAGLREGVLRKLVGLSEDEARRSTVPSGIIVAGLVRHLTFVESRWFEEVAAGRKQSRGVRSMQVDPSVSLRTLRAEYKAACEEAMRSSRRSATRARRSCSTRSVSSPALCC
jgi:uncharacterized protein DUF664